MKYSLLLFLLLPCLTFAGITGQSAEKKINRDFTIQTNGRLAIENKYGDIDLAIGENNKIKFEITVRVTAGSQKKAQDMVDRITVNFSEGHNRVDAVTDMSESSSWLSWFNVGSQEIEINYHVFVPRDIYLQLTNKYGSIYLESTDRDATINLSFGDIRLGDINANLNLDMTYSDGSISQIKKGDFTMSYADLDMENSESLDVELKYSELTMGSSKKVKVVSSFSDLHGGDVGEVSYSGKYDDLHFDSVKSIQADCGFTDIELDALSYSGNFDMQYGDLSISNIRAGFSRIDISSSYTGVELEFSDNASFSVDADTKYCDINHDDLKIAEYIERETSVTMKASRGSGGGMVKAVMTYGELSIE